MIDDAELAARVARDAKLDKLNRVGDILEAALLSYRCQYTEIDDGVGGDGFFGPKPCAVGRQATVRSHTLTQRDARQIFGHIRPLLGEEWLRERIEEDAP